LARSGPEAHGLFPQPRAVEFLLIGGGLASATAAETLRDHGAQGSILILGAEAHPPYHRPALSKQMLSGSGSTIPTPVLRADALAAKDIGWLGRRQGR
jgi:NADPH-dependent 2,4-dienoyl-CoA reductase/sulfur reductase-like enzyme